MNRILTFAILLFSIALPICAQVQTGSILIKITDAQGAIMPGVSVSLSSPVLSGPTIATTDERGVHRFPSLLPGTYAVKLAGTMPVNEASPMVDTTSANVKVNIREEWLRGTPVGRGSWALRESKVR